MPAAKSAELSVQSFFEMKKDWEANFPGQPSDGLITMLSQKADHFDEKAMKNMEKAIYNWKTSAADFIESAHATHSSAVAVTVKGKM